MTTETTTAPEMLAHRIASEVARRLHHGPAPLGRDTIYNLVREAAILIITTDTEGN